MLDFPVDNLDQLTELKLAGNLLANLPSDLTSEATKRDYAVRAKVAVKYSRGILAYKLLKQLLSRLINIADANLHEQYQPIIVWLYYASFTNLSESELVEFFQNYDLSFMFRNDDYYGGLIEQLRARLLLKPIDERDKLREKIYNSLHGNQCLLSRGFLLAGQKGTIANWLREYDSRIGLLPAESIALAEFHNQAATGAALDESERLVLRRFLEFYEYLKLSSTSPAGFEDDLAVSDGDKNYLLSAGEQIELARIETELRPLLTAGVALTTEPLSNKRIIDSSSAPTTKPATGIPPAPSRLDISQIMNQARTLLTETNGDVKQVINKLDAAAGARSVNQALACLLLLAQLRRLDDVLVLDGRFQALVTEDLKKAGQDAMLEGFRLNPTAPNFLARFLKIVLQEKLGLSEGDALGFIQKLIPVLALEGEKYGRIVVEDGKGGLKWNL